MTAPQRQTEFSTFDVQGMDCAACADSITESVRKLDGVVDVHVNVVGGRVRVEYWSHEVRSLDIVAAIRRAGFVVGARSGQRTVGMTARVAGDADSRQSFWARRGRLVITAVSGLLLVLGIALHWLADETFMGDSVLALATIVAAWHVVPRAWRSLRNKTLDMHFLMLAAAMGAAGIGQWTEGAAVLFLFSLAQLLESWSMERSRRAIAALLEVSPQQATVLRGGVEITVAPAEVDIGEVIVVRPGEKVPLDGDVTWGDSSVNEAAITGESLPVTKSPSDAVFAGSLNEHGLLKVQVTRHAADSTLSRIIHAVEEAQASRAPTQSFVDRFARVYTPVVVGFSVALAVIPPFIGGGTWGTWFYRALAMLVIACPCALVISTPISIVSALAGLAHRGVLIKGGLFLEELGAITKVAFDKTGTLTHGEPAVTDVICLADTHDEADIVALAASLEHGSEHALARAVNAAARRWGLTVEPASAFRAFPGRGVRGDVADRPLHLGNARFCRETGVWSDRLAASFRQLEQQGKSAVALFDEQRPLGILGIADQIRANAPRSVAELREMGLALVMLTGDNHATAQAVAAAVGIEQQRSELLPEDKVDYVNACRQRGERVAFVGDGINDAPALAAANLGLAMGAAGTDVAIETSDVALMGDDLSKIAYAIRLSRKTSRIIRQNIVFSIAIKLIVAVFAIAGLATLWLAVLADMGASLAVTFNGLRCRRL